MIIIILIRGKVSRPKKTRKNGGCKTTKQPALIRQHCSHTLASNVVSWFLIQNNITFKEIEFFGSSNLFLSFQNPNWQETILQRVCE